MKNNFIFLLGEKLGPGTASYWVISGCHFRRCVMLHRKTAEFRALRSVHEQKEMQQTGFSVLIPIKKYAIQYFYWYHCKCLERGEDLFCLVPQKLGNVALDSVILVKLLIVLPKCNLRRLVCLLLTEMFCYSNKALGYHQACGPLKWIQLVKLCSCLSFLYVKSGRKATDKINIQISEHWKFWGSCNLLEV